VAPLAQQEAGELLARTFLDALPLAKEKLMAA
jgi:hypothetical protein